MGDSAMSMMSGPHGNLGPAPCRNLPSIAASTSSDSQALWDPPSPSPRLQTCITIRKLFLVQPD